MKRCIALVALFALATPGVALAGEPKFDLDQAVRDMPMRSLERQLQARATAGDIVRRTADVLGLADNDVRRMEDAAKAPVVIALNRR